MSAAASSTQVLSTDVSTRSGRAMICAELIYTTSKLLAFFIAGMTLCPKAHNYLV